MSFSVPRGRVFGFLGPNGAGKTTTMHVLLGLIRPDAGTARVLDLDPQSQGEQVRARCGALLEHHGLYERLTAEQNLDFAGRINRIPLGDRRERAKQLLESIGLWDRRKDPVGKWSKGMKQRLSIARALLHRPDVLFLDEPTAGFDPKAAGELRDEILRLVKQEGLTVFLNTHNLHEAERVCDSVAVLQRGRLLAVGAPQALRQSAGRPRLEIRGSKFPAKVLKALESNKDVAAVVRDNGRLVIEFAKELPAAPIVRALVDGGADVEEVRREYASLEQAFLKVLEAAE
ncbi:MAG TPA: ABC transporter ATP-binding protein [Candidatus Thermoplasmatota archaeon]|nr:ABC transporter ATP-binding protein [Candidatus Thermoplasmatota archaeon]